VIARCWLEGFGLSLFGRTGKLRVEVVVLRVVFSWLGGFDFFLVVEIILGCGFFGFGCSADALICSCRGSAQKLVSRRPAKLKDWEAENAVLNTFHAGYGRWRIVYARNGLLPSHSMAKA
jgi:hypothetical protein